MPARNTESAAFLSGGGEMGAYIRAVRLLLSTQHPMFIWWGPELIQFYNDAYRRSIEQETFDIVLLDIGLPDVDGYEVARRIRAGSARVRLIALTGYGQTDDRQRAAQAGFEAHLVKPVDVVALEALLAASP